MPQRITNHRVGPGHYEVRLDGETLGWLFDDVQEGNRPASDPEPWRFSPFDAREMTSFVAMRKRDALAMLRAEYERSTPLGE